jgi:DNA-directed RNA polymerase subunit beta'
MDENCRIYNPDPCSNTVLNWHFLHHNYCEEISTIMSLGQFIFENVCIAKNAPQLKSGQALIVQIDEEDTL